MVCPDDIMEVVDIAVSRKVVDEYTGCCSQTLGTMICMVAIATRASISATRAKPILSTISVPAFRSTYLMSLSRSKSWLVHRTVITV